MFWTQDFVWGSFFTVKVKASAFQPSFSSIRARWCTVEDPLSLFHRDDFSLAPFPTARPSATTRASNLCLSLPPSCQSLPGANISLAKDSSSCWAWSWDTWQKVFHTVHTKMFQIPDFPGCFLLFIYLLTYFYFSLKMLRHRNTQGLSTVSTVLVSLTCWALGCSLCSSDHVLGHGMVS